MPSTAIARCRSCGAPIEWMSTINDKKMPLDIEPTVDGNVQVIDRIAHVLKASEQPVAGQLRYTSHFATCPNAAAHRTKDK